MNLISIKNVTFTLTNVIPILFVYIYFYIQQHMNNYENKFSSVWCRSSLTGSKLCKFKNVCYDPKLLSFLFMMNDSSVIRGLSHYSELQTIQLSSVLSHNKFEANISIINSDNCSFGSVQRIKKALVFSRFKPDNIMHVIHDDLIPVYLTLQEICHDDMVFCYSNYQLFLHDNYPKGPYFDLYKLFTSFEPVLLPNSSNILCIDELHMGILQDSVFYQYGFNQVQGPVENVNVTGHDLSQFASFISKKLDVKTDERDIVLISRKKNRRILNEESLIAMLETICKQHNLNQSCKVATLDLSENKTNLVINAVRHASMLVGMHGAEMIFSIFLKQNSTVIELFPFGIQPDVVSFAKALSRMEGIHFRYVSWENNVKNNSVFHPEADPLHGGIYHLPKHIQDKIISTGRVPAVKCCNDPTYLYHMYQDTWIDSGFQKFIINELVKTKAVLTPIQVCAKWVFPSVVTNVTCFYDNIKNYLNLSWTKPFNVRSEELIYDVFVLGQSNFKINIVTEITSLSVNVSTENNSKFQIWISAVVKVTNNRGKDVYTECN